MDDARTPALAVIEHLLDGAEDRWPVNITCTDYPLDCNGHFQAVSRSGARTWMIGHAAKHGGSIGFGMWPNPNPDRTFTLEGTS